MKKLLSALIAAVLCFCALAPALAAGAEETPKLLLTYVPVYGETVPFAGAVLYSDGTPADPAAWRVTLYLQLEEGETCWVKPYAESGNYHSYVTLSEDGSFSLPYVTGGSDQKAKILHILLVPGDLIPGSDFDATRAAALDYLRVDRSEDGTVTLSEERTAPVPEQETEADPGRPSGLPRNAGSVWTDVGLYIRGNSPDRGDAVPKEDIRALLTAIRAFSDTVRFYSAVGQVAPAYGIAKELGFTVIGTAWLGGDEEADRAEMDALIALCDAGLADMAAVGSETLLRGDLTRDELIADIEYVRSGLTKEAVAVTTAEDSSFLLTDRKLAAACDVLFVNIYPFWGGVAAEDAPISFIGVVEQLKSLYPGKELICSETGWPTAGSPKGDAIPGEENAAAYFAALREWSADSGVSILFFDAADEPWKEEAEGDVGSHWGFMMHDLTLKDAYREQLEK